MARRKNKRVKAHRVARASILDLRIKFASDVVSVERMAFMARKADFWRVW